MFLPENKLLTATAALIGVEGDCLAQGLDGLIERGEVVREDIAGVTACYPAMLGEEFRQPAHPHFLPEILADGAGPLGGHPPDLAQLIRLVFNETTLSGWRPR